MSIPLVHKKTFTIVGKLLVGWIVFLSITQCKDNRISDDTKIIPSYPANDAMLCTSIVSNNGLDYHEYLLSKDFGSPAKVSGDCRMAARLLKGARGTVNVTIRHIGPETFKGAIECDQAVAAPPDPSGSRRQLSAELGRLPYDTRISVVLYALSLPKCLIRVFPSRHMGHTSSVESVSLRWLAFRNERKGYDLSKTKLPSEVMPIAAVRRHGILNAIICAQVDYENVDSNWSSGDSEFYSACLSNFSDISSVGDG